LARFGRTTLHAQIHTNTKLDSCVTFYTTYIKYKSQGFSQTLAKRTKKGAETPVKPDDSILIGYARVSTKQQSLQMQIDMLIEVGVLPENIYEEQMSGRADNRPQLKNAIRQMRDGDTLVVYKLDRLSRDLPTLIKHLDNFASKGVRFKSITEGIEINLSNCKPAERLQVHMIASLAQFEVDQSQERSRDGVKRAQARGVKFGRQEKITDKQVREAIIMRDKGKSLKQIAEKYGVVPNTILRRIDKYIKENP